MQLDVAKLYDTV